jgi:uncharacterized damage-inducible protein DinB
VTDSPVESLRSFYADWAGYNRRTVEGLRRLSAPELALRVPAQRGEGIDHWPIWAIAGHTAGTRIFWLCHVFGEPGAETTPFTSPDGLGWEDDLSSPKSADDVAGAFESTWAVVEGCLRRWTPAMLGEEIRRDKVGRPPELHTRQSILLRLINHEAYHPGKINVILGANGHEPIDPWPGREWEKGAPRWLREGRAEEAKLGRYGR